MRKRIVVLAMGLVIAFSMIMAAIMLPAKERKGAGEGRIAVIHVDGLIVGGRGQSTLLSESGGTDQIIRQLHDARDDHTVRAIVLRINSPGGSVPASQELGEEVKKVRAAGKIVVASMGDVAASGGYWIAALSDRIYANPGTITGSIGVYFPYSNWQELYQKIGVKQEKIKSGPHKDILSPERPMTDQERAIIQAMVDEMYNQFVAVVAEGRKLDPARVRQLADGRIYTGNQAKELGLVDELGNLYDAIDKAAQMAGIQGKPILKEYGKANPLAILLGAADRFGLEQVIGRQLAPEFPFMAPLALPEW